MNHLLLTHSVLRWIALILIIATIVRSIISLSAKREYTSLDNKLSLFALITVHVQLILGLGLYFMSPIVHHAMEAGMGAAMKDSVLRFWLVEHGFAMIIAIALITIGRIASKNATDNSAKFKKVLFYFSVALLIMLVSIPWPFREILGRGWL